MKENVVIIGGGIAGMEAAKQLLLLGLNPIIVEKSDNLGGHVANWHKLFPDMTAAVDVIIELKKNIVGATVFLSTTIKSIQQSENQYHFKLSNGAQPRCLNLQRFKVD